MLELILFSFLSIFIVTPCGYIFNKNNNQIINLSNHLIYGIILISFITLVINFFFSTKHNGKQHHINFAIFYYFKKL